MQQHDKSEGNHQDYLAKKSREQRRIALFNPFLWFGFWLTDDSFPMRWTYGSNCFGSIFLAVWELEEVPSKTRYLYDIRRRVNVLELF